MKKAKDLKVYDRFLLGNMRRPRICKRIIEINEKDLVPEEHKGKLLIIYDQCKQMIMDKEQELVIL